MQSSVHRVRIMPVSKLLEGVLVVESFGSRRAFRPKFTHRVLLVWVFRYFASLPLVALSQWQKTLVYSVMSRGTVAAVPSRDSEAIIGTVENAAAPAIAKPVVARTDWGYLRRDTVRNRLSA